MTKEEQKLKILEKHFNCVCADIYKIRGMADPYCGLCTYHSSILEAMEEYATQQKEGIRWVNMADRFPDDWESKVIRYVKSKIIIDNSLFIHINNCFKQWPTGRQKGYNELEWLDESAPQKEGWIAVGDAKELWRKACMAQLKLISQGFLDKDNQAKTDSIRDREVFQALGETIISYPIAPFEPL